MQSIKQEEGSMRTKVISIAFSSLMLVFILGLGINSLAQEEMPFGGADDVKFANNLWKAMQGYEEWPMSSGVYPGTSPHGKFLRMYYNMVHVDGTPYHIIVKDNFGGEDATQEKVAESPGDYLAAVTIMLQREDGYDPENNNWFWVKYGPDGKIMQNPKGVALAGRVAKGTGQACISCHAKAKGDDYLFSNDQ